MTEVENKEIEEMAKIVCKEKACSLEYCNKVIKYPNRYMCLTRNGLNALYSAGYGKVEDYKKEIERLKEEKQQAIKEFAEKLKDKFNHNTHNYVGLVIKSNINDLLKEYGNGEKLL